MFLELSSLGAKGCSCKEVEKGAGDPGAARLRLSRSHAGGCECQRMGKECVHAVFPKPAFKNLTKSWS